MASSPDMFDIQASNVVELGTDSDLCSEEEPESWIRYDFKTLRVAPTSYSIRSDEWAYPRSWVFEVSNDGSDDPWEIVDRRYDTNDLKGPYLTHNFAISDPPREGFRFVHLHQTGQNRRAGDDLDITSLEVFGTLSFDKNATNELNTLLRF